jgi:hypothetical protein
MYIGLHAKCLLFLSSLKFVSLNTFSKSSQIPNFMKIRPLGAELFHADGQTDTTKLIVAILNSANVPENRNLIDQ